MCESSCTRAGGPVTAQRGLPGVEAAAHTCGPLCGPDGHLEVVWLARRPPHLLAAHVRVDYLAAGIRLTTNAPATPSVVAAAGLRRPSRLVTAWLVGWAR